MYDQILSMVLSSEEKLCRSRFGHANEDVIGLRIPISAGDISLLADDIYRGRSAVTQLPTRITLIRWLPPDRDCLNRIGEGNDMQKWSALRLSDLVCMTKDEATRHQKEVLLGEKTLEDLYDKDVLDFVESRRAEARQYEAYR